MELEVDHTEDGDSALGEDPSTYTDSLKSTLLESVVENGRGYHKYRSGQYILPEDEREQDRLDLQHAMFARTLNDRLFVAPIDKDLHEVLDLGTGTGIWAIECADEHPEANVVGVDLSPIQPTWVPPNCKFVVDDFDTEWAFSQKFDFIHGRMLLTSSGNFPYLFKQAFDALQPGGWLEMQDLYMPVLCDDETMKATAWQEWNNLFLEACSKLGRDASWAAEYKNWMIKVGFEDVQEHVTNWPVNTWPKSKSMKEMGKLTMINMYDGLEGFTVRLFERAFGKTVEESQVFLVDVRKDLLDRKIHSYAKM